MRWLFWMWMLCTWISSTFPLNLLRLLSSRLYNLVACWYLRPCVDSLLICNLSHFIWYFSCQALLASYYSQGNYQVAEQVIYRVLQVSTTLGCLTLNQFLICQFVSFPVMESPTRDLVSPVLLHEFFAGWSGNGNWFGCHFVPWFWTDCQLVHLRCRSPESCLVWYLGMSCLYEMTFKQHCFWEHCLVNASQLPLHNVRI